MTMLPALSGGFLPLKSQLVGYIVKRKGDFTSIHVHGRFGYLYVAGDVRPDGASDDVGGLVGLAS
jgi:hypothetical protein